MIKYIKYLVLFMVVLFMGFSRADAVTCPNSVKKELSQLASRVKANYEVIDNSQEKELVIGENKTNYRVPNYSFQISIYNITDKLYAEIKTTSQTNKFERKVFYEETQEGIYSFKDGNIGDIYNYVVTIKANDEECNGRVLKTLKFTKPRYNAYSEYTYCQNSSSYYCQKFINTEINIDGTEEFLNKIQINNKKNDPKLEENNNKENITNIIKKNWKLYVIIIFGIILVAVVVVLIIRRHNQKKGWKL